MPPTPTPNFSSVDFGNRERAHRHVIRATLGPSARRVPTFDFTGGNGTGRATDVPAAGAVYVGEDNTVHLGVDVGASPIPERDEATEAFEEPLTREQALAIADPFLVGEGPMG